MNAPTLPPREDDWSLRDEVTELHAKVDEIQEAMNKIVAIVEKVSEEVSPTLESLKSNPMLKMLFR